MIKLVGLLTLSAMIGVTARAHAQDELPIDDDGPVVVDDLPPPPSDDIETELSNFDSRTNTPLSTSPTPTPLGTGYLPILTSASSSIHTLSASTSEKPGF